MKKLSLKKIVSFVFVCLFVFSICAVGIKSVKAEEENKLETLFNETNTYNIVADSIDLQDVSNTKSDQNSNGRYETVQQHASYDLTQKNSNTVANQSQITVLTHGYGANASTWTNQVNAGRVESEFAPAKSSIVYKYWQKYRNDLQVVYTTFTRRDESEEGKHDDAYNDIFDFNIYDLTEQTNFAYINDNYNNYIYTAKNIENLFNNFNSNNHLLVLFETSINCDSNDNVYFQFNYLLSRIAKQYKEKMNVLPKYNLIGHSRGGLTNLQYALDHPDMVDNLISIGTPYNGSTTAQIFGKLFCEEGSRDALYDIIDSAIYSQYKSRWNNNYNLYKNINAMAVGGYSSLWFLSEVLRNDPKGRVSQSLMPLVDSAFIALGVLKVFSDYSMGFLKAVMMRPVVALLREILPDSKIVAFSNIFVNELIYDSSLISVANDLCVNLSSQLATGFKGFTKTTRKFIESEEINFSNVATYETPIVHNLEPRDEKILNKVMGALSKPVNGFKYEVKEDDNTIKITGIDKDYLSNITSSTFTIPSTIDGKSVTEIEEDAFYAAFNDFGSGITSVVVSSNVKKIGKDAFRNNIYLTNINVTNADTEIGDSAFAGCTSLTSVTLPDNLVKIPSGLFSGCESLTSITLPTKTTNIGGGAFNGCVNLESVSGLRQVLEIGDYAFYNCAKLNGITFNLALNSFGDFAFANCIGLSGTLTMPLGLKEINRAFTGCKGLTGITLNNGITSIDEFEFLNCEGLTSINITQNVNSIGAGAFLGCKGITSITVSASNGAYKVEGNCLMTKTGKVLLLACNDSTIPDDIKGIGDFACANCDEMVSFVGKTDLEYIGVGAFYGCSKLANVVLYENLTEIKDDAFANCTSLVEIKLPDNVSKLGKEVFSDCANLEKATLSDNLIAIEEGTFENCTKLKEIVFGYNLVGIGNKAFYGCQNLEKVVISTGNDMVYVGSETFDGTSETLKIYVPAQSYEKYTSNVLWQAYASKLSTHNTLVTFNLNGGTMDETSATLTYGAYVEELPQPAVIGRFFDGWYTSSDFNAESEVSIGMVWTSLSDAVTLYAKWSETPISAGDTFEIVYNNLESGVYSGESNPLSYNETTSTITLKNPTRADGYRFMGWYLDENFNSSVIKQIIQGCTGDIVLYAKWAKVYTITFSKNNDEANETITGIEGEVIKLPTPLKNGYHGTWDRWEVIDETYSTGNFGKGYMIGNADVTLNALWEGNTYRIIYNNIINTNSRYMYYPTYEFKYGKYTVLQAPVNNYGHVFKGYYTNNDFTTQIYGIPADCPAKDFNVYVKWEFRSFSTSRGYSVKITDSGRWNQHYDRAYASATSISLTNHTIYKYVKFVIDIEIWEKDDGYQYLMLYDKYDKNNGNQLWGVEIEHVRGKQSSAHHTYHFEFYIEIKNSDWTKDDSNNHSYFKEFYLLYGASGYKADDWYNTNLKIETYFCVEEGESSPNPTIWNG